MENEKTDVRIVLQGIHMALFDVDDVVLFFRPVSKRVQQEFKHQIKTKNYNVVNPIGFPWLNQ